MGLLDFLSGQKQSTITKETIHQAIETLKKYKAGKASLEQKIIDNERWWKMQHWDLIRAKNANPNDPEPVTGYLFSTIANKHADAMDNFPEPNILEREASDLKEASNLSVIIPLVLEKDNNGYNYEDIYSDAWWYKIKHGFSIVATLWNGDFEDGLGDIDIEHIDALDIYWEPGIKRFQKSRNVFVTTLVDNDIITDKYPWLKGKIEGNKIIDAKQYVYDDTVDISGKSMIVDWYYKKNIGGKNILCLTKFIDEYVLESTEDNEELAQAGLYDHGMYPFDIDVLFPEEGTCIGFGYIDVVRNPQIYVDKLDQIISKNAGQAGKKRFFIKNSSSVNEKEFLDWSKELVHCDGDLGEDSIREFQVSPLDQFIVNHRIEKIGELKEISGANDFNRGESGGGVTAASAIMALQEAGNKLSRDMIKTSYRAYRRIIYKCIELIRQFYDEPRKFRISAPNGQASYVQYNNAGLKEQALPQAYAGAELKYRKPVFDIKVKPEKANPFSKAIHNELAKELYGAQMFDPQRAPAALIALEMMSFEGKEKIVKMVSDNGSMFMQMQQMQQQLQQSQMQLQQLAGYIQSQRGGAKVG